MIKDEKISLPRIKLLHPKQIDEVIVGVELAECKLGDYSKIRIVQGLRTFEQQNDIYAQGRTKPGPIVSNAKGGQSYHNYGLAFDFAIMYDKDKNGTYEELSWDIIKDFDRDGEADWMEVVDVFEELGYFWGGRFTKAKPDNPHFEKTYGLNWRKLLEMYNAKKFIPGTKYLAL